MRRDAHHCFVCGTLNPRGLHLKWTLEDSKAVARFTPGPDHQSWDGVTHGGIIAALLDDAMGNCFYLKGEEVVTGRMDMRFREPIPLGCEVTVYGEIVEENRRAARLKAWIVNEEGKVLVEGSGIYLKAG